MTSPHAAKFKVNPPKGILLLGTQGSGKTAIGKAVAQSWGVGLIKFDMGKVFAGLVGESERRMRMALAQVDAAGGVVLIDEIDKGLSGAGSSDKTDGGTTSRVIGTLLTWLQESHPGVFLIATANDITNLRKNHPELLRKGRFDEIWFSDSPCAEERQEIYRIHLKKRGRNPERFDLKALGEQMFEDESGERYGLTGAEIEHAINDCIQERFAEAGGKELELNSKDDITTEGLMEKAKMIKPMSWIARDTITPMRKWSAENARKVSSLMDTKKKGASAKGATVNMRSIETDVDIS
jgi:SpoVK/Ycf46/Vps4 family AAA+-type ATPase